MNSVLVRLASWNERSPVSLRENYFKPSPWTPRVVCWLLGRRDSVDCCRWDRMGPKLDLWVTLSASVHFKASDALFFLFFEQRLRSYHTLSTRRCPNTGNPFLKTTFPRSRLCDLSFYYKECESESTLLEKNASIPETYSCFEIAVPFTHFFVKFSFASSVSEYAVRAPVQYSNFNPHARACSEVPIRSTGSLPRYFLFLCFARGCNSIS